MNGELLNKKIATGNGRLARLLDGHATTERIVREFYLRALSRNPKGQALSMWSDRIDVAANDEERKDRCEDFLWALLNCHEFTTNQ
jgi:hypothetical protein